MSKYNVGISSKGHSIIWTNLLVDIFMEMLFTLKKHAIAYTITSKVISLCSINSLSFRVTVV